VEERIGEGQWLRFDETIIGKYQVRLCYVILVHDILHKCHELSNVVVIGRLTCKVS
jgi:hypothetical protein